MVNGGQRLDFGGQRSDSLQIYILGISIPNAQCMQNLGAILMLPTHTYKKKLWCPCPPLCIFSNSSAKNMEFAICWLTPAPNIWKICNFFYVFKMIFGNSKTFFSLVNPPPLTKPDLKFYKYFWSLRGKNKDILELPKNHFKDVKKVADFP